MYLPVPLPNALTRQTVITFVSNGTENDMSVKVMKIILNLTQADNVSTLKKAVAKLLYRPSPMKEVAKDEDDSLMISSQVGSDGDKTKTDENKKSPGGDQPSEEENKFIASLQV